MGQILSYLMVFTAIGLGIYFYYLSKKEPVNTELNAGKNIKKKNI
jgi:hypothetical protein